MYYTIFMLAILAAVVHAQAAPPRGWTEKEGE